jgi:DNA topoisomerase-1
MAKKSGKNLVIVESPAKAKTINKYLGDDFVVKASMGHVRDLPSKGMGVDLETFKPDYVLIEERGKDKVVSELKKLAKAAPEVFLATDLDREGEAIAWHLKEALGLGDDVKRVIFNAITKPEIQRAFANPHRLDMDRVNAQQARRILDRVVGYEISPLLWRKVARGLSAGRVQSVAVRLVVEREREIEAFVPEEYWKIGAIFAADLTADRAAQLAAEWAKFQAGGTEAGEGPNKAEKEKWLAGHNAFSAELTEWNGGKFNAADKDAARAVAEALGYVVKDVKTVADADAKGPARNVTTIVGVLGQAPDYVIRSIEKKRTSSRPAPPFITSTLQQAAASRLGFGAQRTMRAAQTLYEAGHITYMRTDSTHLSGEALSAVRKFVDQEFGAKYLPEKPNFYSSSNKSAQEAHEAIRPTDLNFLPDDARGKLSSDEAKLYQLIYNRFVACQMTPAQFDQTTVLIDAATKAGKATFKATGRKLVFDGFMRVAGVSSEDQLLPELREQQQVRPIEVSPTQHFTQPPPRYTEASLIKELESKGIGRPSTYASIISVIQDREYVAQIDRRFYATLLGKVVTDKLIEGFPQIMDIGFTADMELKLDQVEESHLDWVKLLRDFYGPLHSGVAEALEKLQHAGGTESPYTCDKCGNPMLYRISKNGFFLACSNRECSATKPVDVHGKPTVREVSEIKCPNCGREMIKRKGRFGEFLGCSGYSVKNEKGEPSCSVIINLDKEGKPLPPKPKPIQTDIACEKCGSPMLLRDSKRGPFLGCSSFPKCRSTKMAKKLTPEQQAVIEAMIPALKDEAARGQAMVAKLAGLGGAPTTPAVPQNITTDIDCDECGKPMIIRKGRRGPFLGCSGYPKCKNTGEVPAKLMEELGLNAAGKKDEPPVKLEPEAAEQIEHEDAA